MKEETATTDRQNVWHLESRFLMLPCSRYEEREEDREERGDMLCDTMMASTYSLNPDTLASAGPRLGGQDLGGRLGAPDSLGGHRNPSHDSLARISSMTNSISPPLHSHGSLSPGENILKGHLILKLCPICHLVFILLRKVVIKMTTVVRYCSFKSGADCQSRT